MKIKIFEAITLKQAIKDCLEEGYFPANSEQIYRWKKSGKIPVRWYDSGTACYKGKFRDVTLNEIKNIEKAYAKGLRLVWVASVGNHSLTDCSFDGDDGVLVGVKP